MLNYFVRQFVPQVGETNYIIYFGRQRRGNFDGYRTLRIYNNRDGKVGNEQKSGGGGGPRRN